MLDYIDMILLGYILTKQLLMRFLLKKNVLM